MNNAKCFGGTLFSLAASVMTDLIHHDPLVYRSLDSAGLPGAFIDAIKVTAKLLHAAYVLPTRPGRGILRFEQLRISADIDPSDDCMLPFQPLLDLIQEDAAMRVGHSWRQ